MKVLGISFGRRNQRCDILVKNALFAAHKAGAEVEFYNTVTKKITHCHACDYCSRQRDAGEVEIGCAFKDDYQELAEKVYDADGIIIAAPVYAVGIVGQFKNFLDRIMPAHDRAALLEENKKREKAGKPLLDPRYFKDRYTGYISVGGAQTHHWVSMGLPMLHLFDFSMCMKCVGHVDAYDQGRTGSPLLDEDLLKQCQDLGTAVAESLGKPYDEVDTWIGPKGVCPVCHNELVSITGSTTVECPICGIAGKLSVEGDEVHVDFSEKEIKRARNTLPGIYEHYNEIQNMITVCVPKLTAHHDELEEKMKLYKMPFEEALKEI
ncbi:MAG: flavodoxin family protein [Lachnospiraceae bacterium]|jgi:multimeric flavodoxin WrbA|nr:flavodoxin family protein [Lachnospiraceae bacterium]